MKTNLMFGVLAIIPSALALSSVLNLTTPAAQAFEVERTRGSNKASRIVRPKKSKATAPVIQAEPQAEPQAEARRSTIVIRGNHGAQKLVTQEGVGGPSGEYKGFPKLEQRGSHGAFRIVND